MPRSDTPGRRYGAAARVSAVLAAAAVALAGCGGHDEPRQARPPDPALRKQVSELTSSDLERYPVWEFALDEEGEEGQDEETVKPRPDLREVDPGAGTFVVKTRFHAREGTPFRGYLTVSGRRKHDLGDAQPVIVDGPKQILFWFGIVEPTRSQVDESYTLIGKSAEELFPLSFEPEVPIRGARLPLTIPGFLYLTANGRVRTIR
jgi:hypothetical protein